MPGLHGRIRHTPGTAEGGREDGVAVEVSGLRGWRRGRGSARYERRVDNQPIWNAKLLSQRICDAANGTAGNIIATPITPRAAGDNADKYR